MTQQFSKPLSPYAFANAVNKRPQMIYNYIKNKMIKVSLTETGKMMIEPEEMQRLAKRWSEKSVTK